LNKKVKRYRSFERWLTKNFPSSLPYKFYYCNKEKNVVLTEFDESGNKTETVGLGLCLDYKNETEIYIATNNYTNKILFVIGHEYCHHLQCENGYNPHDIDKLEEDACDFAYDNMMKFKEHIYNKKHKRT
jgi:Zn-dependent peptidase ImmA (M78 family)